MALCVGIGAFGLTTQLWEASVLLVFVGAANAILNVNAMLMITTHTADEITICIPTATNAEARLRIPKTRKIAASSSGDPGGRMADGPLTTGNGELKPAPEATMLASRAIS